MKGITRYLPDQILLPDGKLHSGIYLAISQDGEVIGTAPYNTEDTYIHLDGILVPGFINGHCHLELSGLKDVISQKTGLSGFIREIVAARPAHEVDANSFIKWDKEMWRSGIQAVGDICNSTDTIDAKQQSNIRYHNFIELFDLSTDRTESAIEKGVRISEQFDNCRLSNSFAPHAPYTVSSKLQSRINEMNEGKASSMHFLEDASEREFLDHHAGELFDTMTELGADYEQFRDDETEGIASLDQFWSGDGHRILVHNTYITQKDIDQLVQLTDMSKLWFCLCPNANLYIEGELPDIRMMSENRLNMMIGTDSLASNNQLSVVAEINTILENYPQLEIEKVLTWATRDGADAFGWDDLGRFSTGSRPGGVLLKGSPGSFTADRIF